MEVHHCLQFVVLLLHLFQIAREMVISPRNPRLGLTALTKRIGLVDQPDNPDGEIIRYRVSLYHNTVKHKVDGVAVLL